MGRTHFFKRSLYPFSKTRIGRRTLKNAAKDDVLTIGEKLKSLSKYFRRTINVFTKSRDSDENDGKGDEFVQIAVFGSYSLNNRINLLLEKDSFCLLVNNEDMIDFNLSDEKLMLQAKLDYCY
ncbi:hypothetical protein MHBO_000285 [Bonamia ostreae]|uniref:Uncharacterized protein n=1 Tax=Bonamia ostreae TaxID=126728 RepID=A0ABV2AF48_9EUKA